MNNEIYKNEIVEETEIIEEIPEKKRPPVDIEKLKMYSNISRIKIKIAQLQKKLDDYDYIGTKIATGRATREEYATQIAQMNIWATEIDILREKLKEIE